MKKYYIIIILSILIMTLAFLFQEEKTSILEDEMIQGIRQGVLINTPLRIDRTITLAEVEKVWGKPNEHYDREDIQTYVYLKNDKRYIIDEDELKEIYHVGVELEITKEEILERMGDPTEKSPNILVYRINNHFITFEKNTKKNTWNLNLFR